MTIITLNDTKLKPNLTVNKSKGKHIDNLRKIKYKQSRLNNNCIAKSIIAAGGAKTTAYHDAKNSALVKTCEAEIAQEFKAKELTVEKVLKDIELGKKLSLNKNDMTAYGFFVKLEGQYLAMFTDRRITEGETNTNIVIVKSSEQIKIDAADRIQIDS